MMIIRLVLCVNTAVALFFTRHFALKKFFMKLIHFAIATSIGKRNDITVTSNSDAHVIFKKSQ